MGMGHPSNVVARARELGEAGWKPREIAGLLRDEMGIVVAEVTVRRWIDQDYAERQNASRRNGGTLSRRWGWKRRLQRIRELREAEFTFEAITKLLHLDFGLDLEQRQVERIARGETSEAGIKRLLGGEA